jgi:predicted NUDIX family NTP pyrophosphohydrolase
MVWAVEQDWDAADLKSNMFEIEWPPRSGRRQMFPELDRAAWFEIEDARAKILKGQAVSSTVCWQLSQAVKLRPRKTSSMLLGLLLEQIHLE